MGAVTHPLPTVEMKGPGGRIIVNKTDVAQYEQDGYVIDTNPVKVEDSSEGRSDAQKAGDVAFADALASGIPHEEAIRIAQKAHDDYVAASTSIPPADATENQG